MQFQTIPFNAAEAEKSGAGSAFFDGNSEQTVKITRAEFVKTSTGSIGIEFDVINRDKQKGYFSLYHIKADGTKNDIAYRHLQALMGAVGATALTPTEMTVKKYLYQLKQEQDVLCINAAELIGKVFVGLFVEIYSLYQGEEKRKMELFGAYNQQRQSYREQCAGVAAQDIENAFEAMLKKSAKSKAQMEKEQQYNSAYSNAPQTAQQNFSDDDIPF